MLTSPGFFFFFLKEANLLENNSTLTLQQALVFKCLQYKSFENTVGKEEIARNEQFLLFP